MSVSGHKSETSIKQYARVEESNKRKMSLCLSDKFTANSNSNTSISNSSNNMNCTISKHVLVLALLFALVQDQVQALA